MLAFPAGIEAEVDAMPRGSGRRTCSCPSAWLERGPEIITLRRMMVAPRGIMHLIRASEPAGAQPEDHDCLGEEHEGRR